MKTRITNLEYAIRPRMKKRWFGQDVKVYDLFELKEGLYWSDPTYGNGGGDYIDFDKEKIVYTFDSFAEADKFKEELTKQTTVYTS